jgi:hypothetical protein
MANQETITETQPPDLLLAVIDYVDNYQHGGISKGPEQVAAALMLERLLHEGEL